MVSSSPLGEGRVVGWRRYLGFKIRKWLAGEVYCECEASEIRAKPENKKKLLFYWWRTMALLRDMSCNLFGGVRVHHVKCCQLKYDIRHCHEVVVNREPSP
jgi:hypothetical protein